MTDKPRVITDIRESITPKPSASAGEILPSGIGLFLLFIAVSFFMGIFVCSQISGDDEDPKSFVWDEFVGMWISCVPLLFIDKEIYLLLVAFFIFRFFDIYKPLGIKSFDSKSGAFYVMTDDVIAGIYSACLISLIILNIH